MTARLEGRSAVVTGAGSGMGRAIAEACAAEGARVVVQDYVESNAEETAKTIIAAGGEAVAVGGDVSRAADVDRAVSEAVERFGRIDVMANIAGIFDQNAPCQEASEELWDRVVAVNLKGVFLGTRRVLREMVPQRSGAIINMASVASLVAGGGGVAYTATKAGIAGFTRQVAFEVAAFGVRVNAIGPGLVFTNLFDSSANVLGAINPDGPLAGAARARMTDGAVGSTPMGRGADPAEIARVAAFLASDDASFVTGQLIVADGGYVLA